MNTIISEISTSRLLNHFTDDKPLAIISTFRSERSETENMNLLRKFKNIVKTQLKLGFTELISRWVEEDGETGENVSSDERSLIIYGISLDDAMKYGGDEFQQSSIIYKDKDKCAEVCTNDFVDYEGHSFKRGNIVRVFNIKGNTPFNINDAKDIFERRKGGPASSPVKSNRSFKLSEMFEVESTHASTFSGSERRMKIF